MKKDALDFLRKLIAAPSPSGFETPAQAVIRERMRQYCDDVQSDVHGNVFATINPKGSPRVMLAGHVDQIGLMITHVTDDGYLYFDEIGGIDPVTIVGKSVLLHARAGDVPGVIGRKPIHLTEKEDRGKPIKLQDLWIDIGARNKKDALRSVEIGDVATVAGALQLLANNRFAACGLDDKVGAFAVVESLRLLSREKLSACVSFVSTVQEEVGLRGAKTSAYHLDPEVGIAVDVGFASDCPDVDKKKVGEISLGKGPILHRGANINPVLGRLLLETARAAKIPVQLQSAPRATGTDANVIQVSRAGVASALVSIPNRYMHTAVEVCDLTDLENTSRLLALATKALKKGMDFRP
ncbi:MAG: M42 family metallopeptidase [Planctomycetota bacterium]